MRVGQVTVSVIADTDQLDQGFSTAENKTRDFDKKVTNSYNNATKSTNQWAREVVNGSNAVTAANDNIVASTNKIGNAFSAAVGPLKSFIAPFVGAAGISLAIKSAREFSASIAEVSTLLDDASGDIQIVEENARRLATTFGGSAQGQAQAFYQVISAGAQNAAEATEILETANRLAVGGITSVETAADGLTSILNAYGLAASDAGSVSDALFVAMRAGKTTIGELSASLGRVAPLAAQVGVGIDELSGSIAALTKGGISTQEAVTGVRAVLAAVTKPSAEAAAMAQQLGIEFNSAALQAQGLSGFMQQVAEATGGSSEALAQLFGGVEAIIPAMALAGTAGDDLQNIMGQMAEKTGATEAAFNKVAESLDFRFNVVMAQLGDLLLTAGQIILSVLVPALETALSIVNAVGAALNFLGVNANTLTPIINAVGMALLVAFGPSILAAVTTLTQTIATQTIAAFARLNAIILANPLGAFATAISFVLSLLWQMRDSLGVVGDWINKLGEIAASVFNFILEAIKPVIDAVNALIKGLTQATTIGAGAGGANIGGSIEKSMENASKELQKTMTDAGEEAAKTISDQMKDAGKEAGKIINTDIKDAGKTAGKTMEEGVKKGGHGVSDEIVKSLDNGSDILNREMMKSFDKGAEEVSKPINQGADKMSQAADNFSKAANAMGEHAIMFAMTSQEQERYIREFLGAMQAERHLLEANTQKTLQEAAQIRNEINNGGRGGSGGGTTSGSSVRQGASGGFSGVTGAQHMGNQPPSLMGTAGGDVGIYEIQKQRYEQQQREAAERAARSSSSSSSNNSSNSSNMRLRRDYSSNFSEQGTSTHERVAPNNNVQIVNVMDPASLVPVINSREGHEQIVNAIEVNGDQIRAILGVS